jgi:putative transposase
MTETSLPLVGFSDRQRAEALAHFALIRPHVEDGVPQTELARVHQVSLSTVQRWVRAYREVGLAGLVRETRSDRGQARGLPEDVILLVEGLALQTLRRKLSAIHALVSQVASEQRWPVPSYAQVYRIVGRLPDDLKTLAQEGAVAYRETFDLLFRREATCANAIWQADHYRLPIFLLKERGNVDRPSLTAIEDDYSRAIPGYRLSWSAPSAYQTSLALRQAIWVKDDPRWPMCGVPACLYTDHGSDFTSKHLEAVAADLKMALIFSQVGRPRGRGKVERLFRTMDEMLFATLPGYAPKVDDPREQREMNERGRKAACLTLAELDAILRTWLLDTYHRREHTTTHMAPLERWRHSSFIPILPQSEAQLDLLLLQPRRRHKVHQEGITFQKAWYQHALLGDYVGDAVTIRYDPMNLAAIRVYVPDTVCEERFLCQAQCVERGGEAVSLQEVVAARTKRRKRVGKALRERERVVKHYASDAHLRERALSQGRVTAGPSEQAETESEASPSRSCSSSKTTTEVAVQARIRWYDDEQEH